MEKPMSSSNSSSFEDVNPCPICLHPVNEEAYLDCCFHKFCYSCIEHWAMLVAKRHHQSISSIACPICKTDNFSIIYGCDGNSFQQHYINKDFDKSFSLSRSQKYRLQCYYTEPGSIYNKFKVQHYWQYRRYLRTNRWLQNWLRREIQALIQEEDVDIIVHHIVGIVEAFLKRNEGENSKSTPEILQKEFKDVVCDAARPFLTDRTERFVNELEVFLASGLNIDAYDEVYLQCLGLCPPSVTSEETAQLPYMHLFDGDFDRTD